MTNGDAPDPLQVAKDRITSLCRSSNERHSLLTAALRGGAILDSIEFTGAVGPFVDNLITKLQDYGETATGHTALCDVMREVQRRVGADRRRQIDSVLQRLCVHASHTGTRGLYYGVDHRPKLSKRGPLGAITKRWALLVGIDRFNDPCYTRLKYCNADVKALATRLNQLGYTCVLMTDDAEKVGRIPTLFNIKAELQHLCQALSPTDLLLAHFASHGVLHANKPYLICQDTRHAVLEESAVSVQVIRDTMRASNGRRFILSLDACHMGVDVGRGYDESFIKHVYDQAEGIATIAASTAQQKAQEWDQARLGVYAYFLLQALQQPADPAKKLLTVDDICNHVVNGLKQWAIEEGGMIQEPTRQIEGIGDMIVADFREGMRN